MSAQHTPGPWRLTLEPTELPGVNVRFCIDTDYAINIAGGQSQEHLGGASGAIFEEECRANARLIAAAPELLEALKAMLSHTAELDPMQGYRPEEDFIAVKQASAAIAKATGEPA
jgi:hypothetical protein